jgi:hypothetical protein
MIKYKEGERERERESEEKESFIDRSPFHK